MALRRFVTGQWNVFLYTVGVILLRLTNLHNLAPCFLPLITLEPEAGSSISKVTRLLAGRSGFDPHQG